MHMPLSGTAVETPVIHYEYVHMSSFRKQAPVGYWMLYEQNIEMWTELEVDKHR